MEKVQSWILMSLLAVLPTNCFKFNIDFDEKLYDCIGHEDISLINYIDYSNITFTRVSDKDLEINGQVKAVKRFPPKSKYSVSLKKAKSIQDSP